MSSHRSHPQYRRRTWPWVLCAVFVFIAIATAVGLRAQGGTTPSLSPTQPAPVETFNGPAPVTEASEGPVAPPQGCLGGAQVSAQMVLDAQAQAPDTEAGAIAVAASFYRWAGADTASVEDVEKVRAAILAQDASPKVIQAFDHQIEAFGAGDVGKGLRYSTAGGFYVVEQHTDDSVTASLAVQVYAIGGSIPQSSAATSFTMVRSERGWVLQDASIMRQPEDVARVGTAFIGGC